MKNSPLSFISLALATFVALIAITQSGHADARTDIMGSYQELAKAADPAFAGFDALRGKQLFSSMFSGGKPATPSCTSCHSENPAQAGKTRAGKTIEPLALSKSPDRYSDPEKVEKWFRRNCTSVLGRECTALEKGDFIAFMSQQ